MSNVATLPQQNQQKQRFDLTPQTLPEAMAFCELLAKSSIVPKDYQGNPGNIIVAMQWGMEIGLPPLQAMQNIAVINGRPSIWGDAMLALVRGSGLLESIKEDISDEGAICTVKRRGEEAVSREFTAEDAKRAGLFDKQGPWKQYPRRMLQMRARGFALRDVFPDVLRGVILAEESIDTPVEKDMGDAEVVKENPPVSKTEALKNKIAMKIGKASVTLESVLKAITEANDPASLADAAKQAKHLNDEEEKGKASAAYKERLAELRRASQVDKETGEILATDSAKDDLVMTYAQVADKINTSRSEDDLAIAADLIQYVGNIGQQNELAVLYKHKATGFREEK